MKRKFILGISIILLACLINFNQVYASTSQEGSPVASFADRIILADGQEIAYNNTSTLLFLNGSLITAYDFNIIDGTTEIPLSFVSKNLAADVSINSEKKEIYIKKDGKEIFLELGNEAKIANIEDLNKPKSKDDLEELIYVPLRFVAEKLGYSVSYYHKNTKSGKTYYDSYIELPTANGFVKDFSRIIIDEEYDFKNSMSAEEALKKTKTICLEGYENFFKNLKKQINNSKHLDEDLKKIEKEINRMVYVGEVSRYYKFSMGYYDILFDRTNEKIYFVIYSSTSEIKEVDINSPTLYNPLFIVG